jgi:hypothetical protein
MRDTGSYLAGVGKSGQHSYVNEFFTVFIWCDPRRRDKIKHFFFTSSHQRKFAVSNKISNKFSVLPLTVSLGFSSTLAITISTTMVAHIVTRLLKLHKYYLLKLTLLYCHIRLKKRLPTSSGSLIKVMQVKK